MTTGDLASRIDHAVLGPATTARDVEQAAARCLAEGVRGLCVLPHHAARARRALGDNATRLVVVAAFPLGVTRLGLTVEEIRLALADGADELDVVLPAGMIAEGAWSDLRAVARRIVQACEGKELKLIVEASELDQAALEGVIAALFPDPAIRWLKTGTGVYGRPLESRRIAWLRERLPAGHLLKVAGGLRDLAAARAALAAGADLLGSSRTFEWLEQAGS